MRLLMWRSRRESPALERLGWTLLAVAELRKNLYWRGVWAMRGRLRREPEAVYQDANRMTTGAFV